ncbi:hypothetical protein [Rubellimicrobium roseum]|uniref:Quercetin 2,3-dioxygenase C-terminal cupin domain-containing protein n=1 Tax=Rubellimicrobium roseum TaxID=687525 RepID=A0A5C4NBV8_9RHOB|nr:hypothetical protein [Rubellimicrobium roseum]TNC72221.1 hypothetical protein FHG71_09245 [Rubellimicrobium roseum]
MRVIAPDFDRLTERPGAGPLPRPVEIGPEDTRFRDLLSLVIDDLPDGSAVEGHSADGALLLVLLAGAVTIAAGADEHRLDADGDWALLLPPGQGYRIAVLAPATLAEARVRAHASFAPLALRPKDGTLALDGPGLALRLVPLGAGADASAGLGDAVERLVHLTGPARVTGPEGAHELPPAHTLALAPGEAARVEGMGEMLVLAALRPGAAL